MAVWFLRIAVLYLIVGVILGWIFGITDHLGYANIHAHINLLGFATFAIAGIIYRLYPEADNRLAVAQFWMQNIGLIVFMIGLAIIDSGGSNGVPPTAIGSLIAIAAVAIFAVNVWRNVPPGKRNA